MNDETLANALQDILSCFENIETHPALSVAAENHWIDGALVGEDLKSALKNARDILKIRSSIASKPESKSAGKNVFGEETNVQTSHRNNYEFELNDPEIIRSN